MEKLILNEDIDYILNHTEKMWFYLKNANVLLTGGTGFIGRWLIFACLAANAKYKLNMNMVILSRDPEAFYKKFPELRQEAALTMLKGDIRSVILEDVGYTHIIHAATEASDKLNREQPILMLDTIVAGTQHILKFAASCKKLKEFLFISSGAVYGTQPTDLDKISETYIGAQDPLNTNAAYGNGKRLAEHMAIIYGKEYNFSVKIARCFAFVGPYLSLDSHFAIGNFMANALENKPIEIKGDGSPVRSYLYAADLAISLWTLLVFGKSGLAYNVGSDEVITIKQLAELVVEICAPNLKINVEGNSGLVGNSSRYVPDVSLLQELLGTSKMLSLSESIQRTFDWHRRKQS